ncbi:alpha-D-ribose 1-methylphosphonate 5-triphosphate diphosphatase [Chelativorans sp. Marseille-P2723]|uniref:alpha-D-ribose 1-methylphosphonate 5-triphosphate diphosphatase n=1 Tax=Chelativorans sp. Marseille-P2723 TaxID=2709133 RepID=UPI0015712F1C|nr:alpha-D-ribose 1-methylphosphonate 5-triphosphate diphosphatase [Chelativorans sp. Marseille-P2723]
MPGELVLKNARVVLPDEVIDGSVLIRDGHIADVGPSQMEGGADMEGDFLIPGLVELHTDHLERHYSPRPRVRWNPVASVLAHDAQVAASGITTVLDALRVGLDEDADVDVSEMRRLADAIEESAAKDRLRAEHFIHLRCEVSAPDCLEGFALFENDPHLKLVSLMDHAPGQRQFTDLETYAAYYKVYMNMSDEEFRRFCERRIAESEENSPANRRSISEVCRANGIILASHDDATIAHVEEAAADGVLVAEFPTTAAAASASKEAGMAVLMGAPNVVRGASHSGNVSARELAERGHLDILSSDYIPFSLVQAAFFLGEVVDSISLPEAVAMVSKNPAEAVGFKDRGAIEIGRRADLVRVRLDDGIPVVRTVWREGRRIA